MWKAFLKSPIPHSAIEWPRDRAFVSALFCLVWLKPVVAETWDIDLNGSISQSFIKTTENSLGGFAGSYDGSFEFTELLLGTSKDITDNLRAGAQLISRDYGKTGNFDVLLDWGYGDYQFREELGFRLGKMKLPYGLYNESRDVDAARNSALLDLGMYPEDWRVLFASFQGAEMYGNFELDGSKFGDLDYRSFIGTMNIPDDFYFVEDFMRDVDHDAELDSNYATGFQLTWNTPKDGLIINGGYVAYKGHSDMALFDQGGGVNANAVYQSILTGVANNSGGAFADGSATAAGLGLPNSLTTDTINEAFELEYQSYTLGLEYLYRNWTFFGEYAKIYIDSSISAEAQEAASIADTLEANGVASSSVAPLSALDTLASSARNDGYRWYVGAAYAWTEKLVTQLSYSYDLQNKDLPNSVDHLSEDICLSVRYDFQENWVGKLEFHDITGKGRAWDKNTGRYSRQGGQTSEDWNIFIARVSFSF